MINRHFRPDVNGTWAVTWPPAINLWFDVKRQTERTMLQVAANVGNGIPDIKGEDDRPRR